MRWQLQVAKLALIGHMPFAAAARRVKRRLLGYEPDAANLRDTLADLADMQVALAGVSRSFAGAQVMEIGSGWFPVIPIALSKRGARQVVMTDHLVHLDETSFAATVQFLKTRFPEFHSLDEKSCLADFPVRYVAPFNIKEIDDASLDVVISRTVLEHIPEVQIESMLRSLLPKLSNAGVMVHCVDHSDHLAHRDKAICMMNFLTWPDWKHRLINQLTCEGENRMSHSGYVSLFKRSGYRVLSESRTLHAETAERVKHLKLQPRFQLRSPEDLATLRSLFVIAPASPC